MFNKIAKSGFGRQYKESLLEWFVSKTNITEKGMESFWPKNQYSWCQLVFCQTTVASMNQPSKKKDLKLFFIGKLTSV